MDHSNSVKKDRPRYASLTAGLLARKGEAVPVAASFSPEAMAQHLPAKRLAQEFENENVPGWRPFKPRDSEPVDDEVESDLDETPDMISGPLDQRAYMIEEAFIADQGRLEPSLGPDLDLFGDESPNEDEGLSLGLNELVDRAIESAQRKHFDEADDFPLQRETVVNPGKELPKSSCASVKSDLVASIRNASLAEQGAGTGVAIDPRRYIRLQVAAMKLDVTKQELVAAALDSFLDTLLDDVFSECSCMQKGLI